MRRKTLLNCAAAIFSESRAGVQSIDDAYIHRVCSALQESEVFLLQHSNRSEKIRWALELTGETFKEVMSDPWSLPLLRSCPVAGSHHRNPVFLQESLDFVAHAFSRDGAHVKCVPFGGYSDTNFRGNHTLKHINCTSIQSGCCEHFSK